MDEKETMYRHGFLFFCGYRQNLRRRCSAAVNRNKAPISSHCADI